MKTVILNVPAMVKSLAGMVAVSSVVLIRFVARSAPLSLTTEVETKFVPVTVMVNPASPKVLLEGEMLVVLGSGLSAVFTVKLCALEVPPPGVGLNTLILYVPGVLKSFAGMVALSCVLLTKVVIRFESLNLTTDPDTKFVPLTVMLNSASPAVLLDGRMPVVVGTGLFTVNA